MRHPRRAVTLALALLACGTVTWVGMARAGLSPPGVNLRWDQCYADGGVLYRDFACDTNAGSERLVGSFELASDMPLVSGLEIDLHVGSAATTLPAWWAFRNAGSCRQFALAAQFTVPAGAQNCVDWAGGQSAGGITTYDVTSQGQNHARIKMASAVVAPGVALFAGQEYFAFSLTISHAKTVGTGACTGCLEPVVIFLSAVNVTSPSAPSVLLTNGANYSGSKWVSWQHGYPINVSQGCSMTGGGQFCLNPTTYFDVVPYSTTPVHSGTWGAVKSLYR
jgi:hypothetical protein